MSTPDEAKEFDMSVEPVKAGAVSSHIPNETREELAGVILDADMMLPAGALALAEWSKHLADAILAAGYHKQGARGEQ